MKARCPGAWAQLPAHARRLFGIELQAHELEALDRYLRILEQWSARMNLVATRSRDEIIDRHLIDSLALARWARTARVAVDLGSGAGFPGVPLAVIAPRVRFHLIESPSFDGLVAMYRWYARDPIHFSKSLRWCPKSSRWPR